MTPAERLAQRLAESRYGDALRFDSDAWLWFDGSSWLPDYSDLRSGLAVLALIRDTAFEIRVLSEDEGSALVADRMACVTSDGTSAVLQVASRLEPFTLPDRPESAPPGLWDNLAWPADLF